MVLTSSQVQAQVASVLARHADRSSPVLRVGLYCPEPWRGTDTIAINGSPWRIAYARSPLAARESLLSTPDTERLVLLTAVPEQQLPRDILARLSGRRLYRTSQATVLREIFQAQSLDPRTAPLARWSDILLEQSGVEGWLPAPGGHLTPDFIWPQLLSKMWQLDVASGELDSLLGWAHRESTTNAVAQTPTDLRLAATDWLESRLGHAARLVLAAIGTKTGMSPIAIGLCCEVLFDSELASDPIAIQSRTRLERFVGNEHIPPASATAWANAARRAADALAESDRMRLAASLDELLSLLHASSFSTLSAYSEVGFKQRMARFAADLSKIIDAPGTIHAQRLRDIRTNLGHSRLGTAHERRLAKTDLVLRCVAGMSALSAQPKPLSLSEAIRSYINEQGYLDWARANLAGGDDSPEVSDLIRKLLLRVRRLREEQNKVFGALLADWVATTPTDTEIVRVEHALDRIVAPIARACPILLLVLDGMSVAVHNELREDLLALGWTAIRSTDPKHNPLLMSAIPSVTEFARASLLTGSRVSGGQSVEASGFSAHDALVAASRGQSPLLFHKGSLSPVDDSTVSTEVREAIQSSAHVVGIVLNAVDDLLSKGDQVTVSWRTTAIRLLPSMIGLARDSGRAIVIISDHGHVLESGTSQLTGEDADRYRNTTAPPADGELLLEGPGVHPDVPGQRLIAPWSEAVRYGARKAGYHGGISAQEIVVPYGAFWYGHRIPTDCEEIAVLPPGWWNLDDKDPGSAIPEPNAIAPRNRKEPATPSLFDHPTPRPAPASLDLAWLDSALGSELFAAQRRLAGRTPPSLEEVRRLILALWERGGKLTKTALARNLGLPELRLPGYLSLMRRILNVDGYPVLVVHEESHTVEFNQSMFIAQYGAT